MIQRKNKMKKGLIKDEQIRETLKNWAIINQIPEVIFYCGDYDHAGVCLYDGVVEFRGVVYRLGIQFENTKEMRHSKLKHGKVYSIYTLVGDEE